jgi:hypothetical protein
VYKLYIRKACGGRGGFDPRIPNLETRRSIRFIFGERTTGARWIGGWVSVRTGLDLAMKEKSLLLL